MKSYFIYFVPSSDFLSLSLLKFSLSLTIPLVSGTRNSPMSEPGLPRALLISFWTLGAGFMSVLGQYSGWRVHRGGQLSLLILTMKDLVFLLQSGGCCLFIQAQLWNALFKSCIKKGACPWWTQTMCALVASPGPLQAVCFPQAPQLTLPPDSCSSCFKMHWECGFPDDPGTCDQRHNAQGYLKTTEELDVGANSHSKYCSTVRKLTPALTHFNREL